LKKLFGRNDIEDALKRLEKLNVEEDRMATAVILNVSRKVDEKMTQLMDGGEICISLVVHATLRTYFTRWERNSRASVTRETSGVALSSRSLDKL
jgi:hypothetical protein